MLSVMDRNANKMEDDAAELEEENVTETLLDGETNAIVHPPIEELCAAEEPAAERQTWGKKIDFLLSVIGFAVDLANVWRFPYLCYKNGGGAFLVPYLIMLVFGGIPLFYMELALGQYYQKGAISAWGMVCPIFKGIGWAVVLIAFFTDFFYNVIISWALYYLFASFTSELPWTTCGSWATESCFSGHNTGEEHPVCIWKTRNSTCKEYQQYKECVAKGVNCTVSNFTYPIVTRSEAMISSFKSNVDDLFNVTSDLYSNATDSVTLVAGNMGQYCDWQPKTTSPAAEYFQRGVLGLHEVQGINDVGSLRWQNVLCLLAIYVICYFSLFKGIVASGKVVWFTALFPYFVLFILLIRGVTLEGANVGIKEYITPNFSSISKPQVWVDAATQVFFSLGPGFGVLLAFSSYNKFDNNVYRDALLTSLINSATSFLAGFVVFSFLGYLSVKTCKGFYDVAQEGPGLVFEVYPEAIATLPGSVFWAIIFFVMLLTLGLDSSFGGSEAIITGLADEFKILKNNREIFVAVLFIIYFLVGLGSCTYGGFYVVKIFEVFAAGYSILFAVFCESVVISWIYGGWRFSANVKEMIGSPPGPFWIACWSLIAPIFLGSIMIYGMVDYKPLTYQDYEYPTWANVFGWLMAGSSMACIPTVGIIMIIIHRGDMKILFNGWWSQPECHSTAILADYREMCTIGGPAPAPPDNIPIHVSENGDAVPLQDSCLTEFSKQEQQVV